MSDSLRLDLGQLRRAGRIAAEVRAAVAPRIAAGLPVLELSEAVESEIGSRGGEAAFPAQVSCNFVAAHDCPAPEDRRTLAPGDLVKLDLGVHVDGHVVDTAVTCVIDGPHAERRRALAAASQAGLAAVLGILRPGMLVREVSRIIETAILHTGFVPVRGLSGHGVGLWRVHCPPAIPNVLAEADPQARLEAGMVFALEVFATAGPGSVEPRGEAEVLSVSTAAPWTLHDADLERAIRAFRGLPFARRQLRAFGMPRVEEALGGLRRAGALRSYPPLVERTQSDVSQSEHTVVLLEDGFEVLTDSSPSPRFL